MNSKILLFIIIITSFFNFGQPNNQLKDEVIGVAIAFNELWDVYPKTNVRVGNIKSNTMSHELCIITNDNSDTFSSVIGIKVNSNIAIICGYAPGISGRNFNGYGEIVICVRKNGEITTQKHLYEPTTTFVDNNEKLEYIKNGNIEIVIKDKIEVVYFKFLEPQLIYFLPDNYFAYKNVFKEVNQDPVVVNGHVTKKGKFIKSHIRTKQDNTQRNNYSSKPNRNPYTGKKGTKKAKY